MYSGVDVNMLLVLWILTGGHTPRVLARLLDAGMNVDCRAGSTSMPKFLSYEGLCKELQILQ